MNNKRIGIFFPSFNIGGVERVMIDIANSLYARREEVIIIVCRTSGDLQSSLNENIPVLSIDAPLRKSASNLRKYLRVHKIDVLITGPDFPNFIAIFATRFTKYPKKIIITQHNLFNLEIQGLGFWGRLTPVLYRLLYPLSNKIVAVSEAVESMLINIGIDSRKIVKINNPINLKEIDNLSLVAPSIKIEGDYILFVGRLSKVKNLELLIRAFKLVRSDYPDLKLVIVGDGSEREYLKQLADSEIPESVIFTGSQPNPYPYIKNAKLLALVSFSEAFPCVLVESMFLGITPVVTPTTGAIEITSRGRLGYMTSSFIDTNELKEKIVEGLKYPLNKSILKKYSINFDSEQICKKYLCQIYPTEQLG